MEYNGGHKCCGKQYLDLMYDVSSCQGWNLKPDASRASCLMGMQTRPHGLDEEETAVKVGALCTMHHSQKNDYHARLSCRP